MQFLKRSFILGIFVLILGSFSMAAFSHAQTGDVCPDYIEGKTREQLTKDLEACTKEIERWTATLSNTKQQSASYSRDVAALTAKINAAQATIRSINTRISILGKNITQKEAVIVELDTQIGRGRQALRALLRKTNELDSYTVAEAMLSNKDISEFFVDVETYSSTQRSLEVVFNELRGIKQKTQGEKEALAKEREAASNARAVLEASKKEVEKANAEKKALLAQTQTQANYQATVLAQKQAKAAQIRATLFPLRDAGAIPFGTALQYANAASAKTGVRPAFILAILTQESNLGQHVGSCVITNLSTGETKNPNTGNVFPNGIHPTRDLPLLQTILNDLGRDPLSTKVSCPLSIGYGGAMGPAQFIPSTWNGMKSRVASALGKSVADPWNPSDAIMASAMFLSDLGAGAQTYDAEKNAACRYYSGRVCSAGPGNSYGTSVMAKATNIQTTMIDPLQGI